MSIPARLVLATGNAGKLRELQALLAPTGARLLPQAALGVDLPSELGYPALQAIAAEIVAYHDAGDRSRPLVLVLQQDYAQVLGQTLQSTRPGLPLIAIDQVGLGEGDFIDSGLPVLDGRAVPLSIKTLVFYD